MRIESTSIPEVKLLTLIRHTDERGFFVKTFSDTLFQEMGIHFSVAESFYSRSVKNVIRGMHFHNEPYAHDKLIFCTEGAIMDVALDIRTHSPSYGKFVQQEISLENNNALFIPKGFAHGFLTLTTHATVCYLVSGVYSAAHDDGILYNSFGMDWGVKNPIVSARDSGFNALKKI